jgi:predicted  nucleic acid-binding Zn-ribbon protein
MTNQQNNNIDYRWLATTLVAIQNDMRAMKNDMHIVKEEIAGVRQEITVNMGAIRRVEVKQDALLEELRALYPQLNALRARVDELERK